MLLMGFESVVRPEFFTAMSVSRVRTLLSIAVPPGVGPGQTLAVKVPDGRELHVVVPKDAGQELLEAAGSRWKCGMGATNRMQCPMV